MPAITAMPAPVNASSVTAVQIPVNAVDGGLLTGVSAGCALDAGNTFTALLLSAQQLGNEALSMAELNSELGLTDIIPATGSTTEASNFALTEFAEIEPALNDQVKLTEQYLPKENIIDNALYLAQTAEFEQNLSPLIAEIISEENDVEDLNFDSDVEEEEVDVEEVEEQSPFFNLQQPVIKNKPHDELRQDFLLATEAEEVKLAAEFAKEINVEKQSLALEDKKKAFFLSQNQEIKTNDILQNGDENSLAPSTAAHLLAATKAEATQAAQNIIPHKASPMERLANLKDSLSEQVIMQIERLNNAQVAKQGIRVQLHPKELGEIVVQMRMQNDGNTVFEITSNKASSLQLLQLSNLEEIIQRNISLGEKCTLELGLSQQNLGQGGKQQQQNNHNYPRAEINNMEDRPVNTINEYYAVANNAALNISV